VLERVGHYRILERIGEDATSELFRARDTRAGRTVSVRLAFGDLANDPRRRAEFLDRGRSRLPVSHPNIAEVYEVGEEQGRPFLVCEYVPGQPLAAIVGGRPLNPRRALDYTIQLADALAVAHAASLVDGGITLSNIVITPKGSAKLLNFGLEATGPHAAGGAEVDPRPDLVSLGVALHEMLTGRPPGPGPSTEAVPTALAPIIEKMLARHPEESFESAALLAAELRAVAASLDARAAEAARLGSGRAQGRRIQARPKERRLAVWVGILLVALIAGALVVMATGLGERWLSALTRTWRVARVVPPARVAASSLAAQDVGEPRREGRSGHHLAQTSLSGGLDQIRTDVGHEAKRRNL
jgi:serine/threonine-protein kinase